MKYIKLCSILFTITLLTTASNYINTNIIQNKVYALKTNNTFVKQKKLTQVSSQTDTKDIKTEEILATKKLKISQNKVLTDKDLKILFPDDNFRSVITRNFKNQEITINKISNLSGEFYATGEKIENLEGISYLKSIQSFVFVNNNIKKLPDEILNLNNIKSINLINNYITESTILNKLIKKGIDVNYDLNFIKNADNQYELCCDCKNITLKKGEKINLNKLLYKNINNKNYEKYWEVTNEISNNINYSVSIYDSKVLNLEHNNKIKAASFGECTVKISLDDNFYNNSTITINIKVE